MTKLTLTQMMQGLNDLTIDELRQLNQQLIVISRHKQKTERVVKAASVIGNFQIGDVIRFVKSGRGRNAGVNYFIYQGLNRNRDCMQGPACDENGITQAWAAKWTVPLTQPTARVVLRNGQPFSA